LTEHAVSPEEPNATDGGAEESHPLGTLFVLMIFLIVLAGMWGAVYVIYLGR
jgi:hypothetical protein